VNSKAKLTTLKLSIPLMLISIVGGVVTALSVEYQGQQEIYSHYKVYWSPMTFLIRTVSPDREYSQGSWYQR
jgi:hypothetical protein